MVRTTPFRGSAGRSHDEGGVALIGCDQITHGIARTGARVDVDECRFAGRLSEPVGHGHHRPLLQPEDVGEVVWEVLEERLLGRAGVTENGRQFQRTKQVAGYFANSLLLGHRLPIPRVVGCVCASLRRADIIFAGWSGAVIVVGDNLTGPPLSLVSTAMSWQRIHSESAWLTDELCKSSAVVAVPDDTVVAETLSSRTSTRLAFRQTI